MQMTRLGKEFLYYKLLALSLPHTVLIFSTLFFHSPCRVFSFSEIYKVLVPQYQMGPDFILQLYLYLIKEHCNKISPAPSALSWKQYALEKWLLETINTNGSPC